MLCMFRRNADDNPSTGEPAEIELRNRRRGATLMEYLMMISLIITVCLVAVGYLGSANNANMSSSATKISNSVKKSS